MIRTLGIVARSRHVLKDYKKQIKASGFKYSLKKADMILCLGGDGTFLEAERKHPKIPKLLIRDSNVCDKCNIDLFDNFIDLIVENKFKIETHNKLECFINGKKTRFLATNDIIIRNHEITQAIRFNIYHDKKLFNQEEVIGDGVVIATPFGSSAYYGSITKETFKKGIGLALNNPKQKLNNKVFDKNTSLKFIINRGKAQVASDNYRHKRNIRPYDEVIVKLSKEKMNIVILKK